MTWSYTGLPSGNNRDAVRFLIGDTDVMDQLIQDEEIEFALEQGGSKYLAAALCCESLAARFGRDVDMTVGALSRSASQRADKFRARAQELRNQAARNCEIFVGGVSVSGKDNLAADEDATQPVFRLGMDDYPGYDIGAAPSNPENN